MADRSFDGEGEPDEETRRRQALLRPMPKAPAPGRSPSRRRVWVWVVPVLMAAAALVFVLHEPAWPCVASDCSLAVGGTLRTDAPLMVELPEGALQLAAGTVLTRERAAVRLERGELGVEWHGAPGEIRVETAAASVIDLGCAFTLRADGQRTNLHVEDGTILLKNASGEAYVTAGSVSAAEVGQVPTLPVRTDASTAFVAGDLEAARPEDLFTLWNMLARVPAEERAGVYAVMRRLAPSIPDEPSPELLALDETARGTLWRSLVPYAL